ncbi:hypothetical protein [Streptomyces sp. NPDC059491]|uniref:hypothetical protein n=1 Tax=Streptomyces sp. NPDC059491 TaxID=3346850 RepID=UPI0036BFBFC7
MLATFTGDTVTLHLAEMKDGRISRPGLFTEGPGTAGDGYTHLVMRVRLVLTEWRFAGVGPIGATLSRPAPPRPALGKWRPAGLGGTP